MHKLQLPHRKQEYITIWWISWIYFLVSILTALFLHFLAVPILENIKRLGMINSPPYLPIPLQVYFSLLLIGGLSTIVIFCYIKRTQLNFYLLCLPLLVMIILYGLPQVMFDFYRYTWRVWDSLRFLLLIPSLLLIASCFFSILGIIIFIRKRKAEHQTFVEG